MQARGISQVECRHGLDGEDGGIDSLQAIHLPALQRAGIILPAHHNIVGGMLGLLDRCQRRTHFASKLFLES